MNAKRLHRLAADRRLMVAGTLSLTPEDGLPGYRSLALLAPDEPTFWAHVRAAPEWGGPDPIDTWSNRALAEIAKALNGRAILPSDGPPYAPFYQWALRSGRAWVSPVTLLVHDVAGLFISYRGAIALPFALETPPGTLPCEACDGQPCRAACPPGALTPAGYDVPACHAFLDTGPGAGCLEAGCLVRRACPVGASRRLPAQSAYHMSRFHR